MIRAGMLTSGGDCQALNPVLRGIARGLYSFYGEEQVELIGFLDGYRGLMDASCCRLTPGDFSDLLTRGGTILGTSRQPFKRIREPDEGGRDKVAAMKAAYEALELDGLFTTTSGARTTPSASRAPWTWRPGRWSASAPPRPPTAAAFWWS